MGKFDLVLTTMTPLESRLSWQPSICRNEKTTKTPKTSPHTKGPIQLCPHHIQLLRDKIRAERESNASCIQKIQLSRFQLFKPGPCLPELWTPVILDKPALFFKVVAAVSGKLVSVFDGETEYSLGHWTVAKRGAVGWPPINCCLYAHLTPQQAAMTTFPEDSKCLDAAKMLLQVEVKGRGYRHVKDVWAFERVKPVKLVAQSAAGGAYVIPAKYIKN